MYRLQVLDEVEVVVADLPTDLLAAFAEVRTALEVSPWTVGEPLNQARPGGLRAASFASGRGLLVFGIIERDRLVTLVQLTAI
ncbi:hypothetical protein [Actinomycetospora sp. TBRC 11914]|uniref:hypothetical protein n=1 Tax=Actinomycetospora sp. TBRC 11914 TaxID=2729387 RepID=UPI00145DABD9|nr:hypothetical protein [Actinomycetospora sp. TBRC 11914]NMO93923.1 hypothetical protein [Actinomycetospora sp. TBRC 11914]